MCQINNVHHNSSCNFKWAQSKLTPNPFLMSTPLEASLFRSLGCHITQSVIQQIYITIVQGAKKPCPQGVYNLVGRERH